MILGIYDETKGNKIAPFVVLPPYQSLFEKTIFYGFYHIFKGSSKNGAVMYYSRSSDSIKIESSLFGCSGAESGNGGGCYFILKEVKIYRTCGFELECQSRTDTGNGDGIFLFITVNSANEDGYIELDSINIRKCAPNLEERRFQNNFLWQESTLHLRAGEQLGNANIRRTNISDGYLINNRNAGLYRQCDSV
jgi:hypothetical protein